jgi:Glycosyltransferase family 87
MAAMARRIGATRERRGMLVAWGLGALAIVLGLAAPPPAGSHGTAQQALDLVRVAATASLAVTLLLGPGIVFWRARASRRPGLAFLPLPGLALLAGVAGLAWALAPGVDPRLVCGLGVAAILAALLAGLALAGPEDLLDREERRCLLIAGCALGIAVARALWSLGPEGELYGGAVSRTLEVGDRSDSRISFILPQLVAHGGGPYEGLATSLFAPYNFSSRGPLPGLAAAPIVLASGGHPPAGLPEQPWQPFDAQGFMAYRLAMMAFACTAFLSLWDLTRRLAGAGAARFAVLLAATTPFLLHEVWFTWPKLLAASFVLIAAICVIESRPLRAGLLTGLGYLMHPVALLSLPALGLIALWPLRAPRWRRPDWRALALLGLGVAAFLVAWRLLNGSHYSQSGFLEYLGQAFPETHPGPDRWLIYRAESTANTLVPLLLPFASARNGAINVAGGISPFSIHFLFQYWTTLPFGLGILFFPLLLLSLWRAVRLWPWPLIATVVVPFAVFAIYWGGSSTGMLREGLQAWVLTLLAVVACQQARAGFPWLRSAAVRAVLVLRVLATAFLALGPALLTRHSLLRGAFALTDVVALLALAAFSATLARALWSARGGRLGDDLGA